MLVAGGAFAAAVFVTYLLLGLGLLKFLSFLNEFSVIAKCVYLLAAIGTFALAFLSLYDAYKAKQGKVAVEEEYQDAVKIIDQKVSNYNRQIDNMFPELDITYEEQGIDYIFVFRKDQVLQKYFGKKLPYDGNSDYFSSD